MPRTCAEVIASSTAHFTAEAYADAEPLSLGQWVRVPVRDQTEVYALVSQVDMAPYDEGRRTVALRKSEEELRREMPQVMELLRTTLRAQIAAHRDAQGRMRQTLPPRPPRIHDFVYPCSTEEIRTLGAPYDFLRALVNNPEPSVPTDDLIVAVLTQVKAAHRSEEELVVAGRALSRLLRDDHERLQSILRRVL